MRIVIHLFLILITYCSSANLPSQLKCVDKLCRENISIGRMLEQTSTVFGELKELKKSAKVNIKGKNVDFKNSLWLIEFDGLNGFIELTKLKELMNSVVEELKIVNNPYYNVTLENTVDETEDKEEEKGRIFSDGDREKIVEKINSSSLELTENKSLSEESPKIENKSLSEELPKIENKSLPSSMEYINADPWIIDSDEKSEQFRSPFLRFVLFLEKCLLSSIRSFISVTGLDSSVCARNVVHTVFRMSVENFVLIVSLLSTVAIVSYTPKMFRLNRDWRKEFETKSRQVVELENRLSISEEIRRKLANQNLSFEEVVAEYRGKVREIEGDSVRSRRELEAELARLVRARDEGDARVAESERRRLEAEAEVALEGLEGELRDARVEVERLRALVATAADERARLQALVDDSQWVGGLGDAERRALGVTDAGEARLRQAEVERLREDARDAAAVRQRLAEAERRLEEGREGIATAGAQRDAAETRLRVLSDYFKEREAELQRCLGVGGAQHSEAAALLDEGRSRVGALEAENGALAGSVARLKAEVREAQAFAHRCKSEANAQIAGAFLAVANLERDLIRERDEAKKLRCRLSQFVGPSPTRHGDDSRAAVASPPPPPPPPIFPLAMLPAAARTFSGRSSANSASKRSTHS